VYIERNEKGIHSGIDAMLVSLPEQSAIKVEISIRVDRVELCRPAGECEWHQDSLQSGSR
jgi:hypothetical protein